MIDLATTTEDTDGRDALRLGVLDDEDLAVVSAHLQNAETSVGDMAYLPREKRFVLVVGRFDWPLAAKGRFVRRRTGVHFERVLAVSRNGLSADPTALTQLLAVTFDVRDAPGGFVRLTFADGAQIRLTVECLEAEMRDLGPQWAVDGRPAAMPAATRP